MEQDSATSTQAYIEGLVNDIRRMSDAMGAIQGELRSLTVSANSPDRLVTAVLNSDGRLVELTLDPRIYRTQDSAALAEIILTTIEQGRDEVERKAADIRGRALPEAQRVADSFDLDLGALAADVRARIGEGDKS